MALLWGHSLCRCLLKQLMMEPKLLSIRPFVPRLWAMLHWAYNSMEEGQFVISSDCFHQSPPLYTFFQVLLMFALTSLRPNTVQKGLLKGMDIEKPKIHRKPPHRKLQNWNPLIGKTPFIKKTRRDTSRIPMLGFLMCRVFGVWVKKHLYFATSFFANVP